MSIKLSECNCLLSMVYNDESVNLMIIHVCAICKWKPRELYWIFVFYLLIALS